MSAGYRTLARGAAPKGWCPSALRPMQSGDGLIARIRPRAGRLSAADIRTVATLAAAFGNGLVDVTSRANLQVRGLAEEDLASFAGRLHQSGLVETTPEREHARIVVVEAGAALLRPDMRRLAAEMEAALVDIAMAGPALPAKFGVGIARDGRPFDALDPDITVCVSADGAAVVTPGENGDDVVARSTADIVRRVVDAVRWFARARHPHETRMAELLARLRPGRALKLRDKTPAPDPDVLELSVPFGSLDHRLLVQAADLSETFGDGFIAPTCRRGLALRLNSDAAAARRGAYAAGFLAAENPLLRMAACSGRPACTSAHRDVRADARRLADLAQADGITLPALHLSGCPKGCAHPKPAQWCLTATAFGYDVARRASAGEAPLARALSLPEAYAMICQHV